MGVLCLLESEDAAGHTLVSQDMLEKVRSPELVFLDAPTRVRDMIHHELSNIRILDNGPANARACMSTRLSAMANDIMQGAWGCSSCRSRISWRASRLQKGWLLALLDIRSVQHISKAPSGTGCSQLLTRV